MVSDEFAGLLKARRTRFNAAVSAARGRSGGFDTDELSRFLREVVDSLWQSLRAADEGRAAAAGDALFDMALTLVEHRWTGPGARSALVETLWREVAPALAPVLATDPLERLGALTNAAIKLGQQPGVDGASWSTGMARLGGQAESNADLRRLAIVTAWRAGAAYARGAALDALERLPPALACDALGAAPAIPKDALVATLRADRWWTPAGRFSGSRKIGGFSGFGGPFGAPPLLAADSAGLLALSGDRGYRLDADAFGASVRPIVLEAAPRGLGLSATTADMRASASPTSHVVEVGPGGTA